jgi:hypothetical protein
MPRGDVSFEGVGFHATTYKAGAGIKALIIATDDRTGLPKGADALKKKPVVISGAATVDLGSDGDQVFGFIDSYEYDGYVSVQDRGYCVNVPTVDSAPTVGSNVATDGAGKVKDDVGGVGVKQSMTKKVTAATTTEGTATVTITAAGGGAALASGKAVVVTLAVGTAAESATAIRSALAVDADVAAYFTIGGTGATITLTRKVATATEDEAFDFALGTAIGTTMGSTTVVDGFPDIKPRTPVFIEVDSTAKTATVFLG